MNQKIKSYQDNTKTRPARLGVVARLYPELTASYLTDALKNIYYRDSKSNDRYKSINALQFEWEVFRLQSEVIQI